MPEGFQRGEAAVPGCTTSPEQATTLLIITQFACCWIQPIYLSHRAIVRKIVRYDVDLMVGNTVMIIEDFDYRVSYSHIYYKR